jgi:hypothetical protein
VQLQVAYCLAQLGDSQAAGQLSGNEGGTIWIFFLSMCVCVWMRVCVCVDACVCVCVMTLTSFAVKWIVPIIESSVFIVSNIFVFCLSPFEIRLPNGL